MIISMGSLPPSTTYIYDRNGEEIYAREAGKSERVLIGHQYENKIDPRTEDGRPMIEHLRENQLWHKIRQAAKTDPVLQETLDRAIILYQLSKEKYGTK